MDDQDAVDLAKLAAWLEALTGKTAWVRRRGERIIANVGGASLVAATVEEARSEWRHVLQLYGWVQ